MKNLNKLWIGLAAVALVATGCDKEPKQTAGDGLGRLTIKIGTPESKTRALLGAITDEALGVFENNIVNFSVYVFNADTGDLEDSQLDVSGTTTTITGLNTVGDKRILVVANGLRTAVPASFIPHFETDRQYERLADGYIMLQDQTVDDLSDTSRGFLMTGEDTQALIAGDNDATIYVDRVVAKVQLGTVTFASTTTLMDLLKFNLTAAGIQRAIGQSNIVTGDITPMGSAYYGAFYPDGSISKGTSGTSGDLGNNASIISTLGGVAINITSDIKNAILAVFPLAVGLGDALDAFLADATNTTALATIQGILGTTTLGTALTSTINGVWYVLPNNNADVPTLLALKGSYNTEDYYYPIEINTPDSNQSLNGGVDGKGTYIKRNTVYTINVTFNSLVGTTDPDEPGKPANLDVTVVASPWEATVTQTTTW